MVLIQCIFNAIHDLRLSWFLAAILVFTAILKLYVIFDISLDGIYEIITHEWLFWKKHLIFIVIFVKICYFGSHFVFRWYLKMLNADRVSSLDFLKLMVSGSQIIKKKKKKKKKKKNYSETKQAYAKNIEFGCRTIKECLYPILVKFEQNRMVQTFGIFLQRPTHPMLCKKYFYDQKCFKHPLTKFACSVCICSDHLLVLLNAIWTDVQNTSRVWHTAHL